MALIGRIRGAEREQGAEHMRNDQQDGDAETKLLNRESETISCLGQAGKKMIAPPTRFERQIIQNGRARRELGGYIPRGSVVVAKIKVFIDPSNTGGALTSVTEVGISATDNKDSRRIAYNNKTSELARGNARAREFLRNKYARWLETESELQNAIQCAESDAGNRNNRRGQRPSAGV